MSKSKKIVWYNLAFMAFSTVWGFGNVVNGFVYFNGVQVIFSWIMMFALPANVARDFNGFKPLDATQAKNKKTTRVIT